MPKLTRQLIVFGAPLLVAILNSFHPIHASPTGVYQGLAPHLPWWLVLHALNLGAFSLLGLAVFLLLNEVPGRTAALSRVAIAAYVPLYAGFDTLAGIGTGILIQFGQTLPPDQLGPFERAVDVLWSNRITTAFGVLGSIAFAVAVFGAGVSFAERNRKLLMAALSVFAMVFVAWGVRTSSVGTWPWWTGIALFGLIGLAVVRPRGPSGLLLLSGMLFGTAHVRPYGPLGMLCLLAAMILLARTSADAALAQPGAAQARVQP